MFGPDDKPVVWEDDGLPEYEYGEGSVADGRKDVRICRSGSHRQVGHERRYRDDGEEEGGRPDEHERLRV